MLRVLENKVLRKISGSKRDVITGEWRMLHKAKLQDAELQALYSSPNWKSNIETTEMGRTCSTHGAIQKCIQSFSGKG